MAFHWNDDPTETLELSNKNSIQVQSIDLIGLAMCSDNQDIPNGMLEQLSAQLNGQAPDQELTCHSGLRLPIRGEPVMQGNLRGSVVDVTGTEERFTVRVSVPSGTPFKAGEVRFGGMSVAMIESIREWQWRLDTDNIEQARLGLAEFGNFLNLIVRAASVMPKVVNEVVDPETEIDINRLKQVDKMIIFKWAMPREVRPAAMFPEEPAASLAAAPDVQGIQPESGDGIRAEAPVG